MDAVQTERIRNAVLLATGAFYTTGYATVGLLAILATAVREVISRTWRWVPTSLDRPLVGLASAAVLSALFSEWRRDSIALSVLLALTMALSVRTVAAYAVGGTDRCLRFLMIWVAGGVAAALWVVVQSDPTGRIPATTPVLGTNGAGTTLAVAVVITMSLLGSRAPGRRWPLAAGLAVLLTGLVGTWARAAWLGAAAGVVALLAVGAQPRGRLATALILLVLMGLAAVLLPRWPELYAEVRSIGSLEANRNRIIIWSTVPKMIADYPLVGVGYGTFVFAYPRYRPPTAPELTPPFAHNLLLNAAAEMGVIGLVAIVALCTAGLASSWRWMVRSPRGSPERTVATTVLAALVALLANEMVDGTVMSVHIGFGFFALLALGAVGDRYLTAAAGPAAAGSRAVRTARHAQETPRAPTR